MRLSHIWLDCGGTLYVPSPELVKRIEDHVCGKISDKTGKKIDSVKEEFRLGHKRYGTHPLAIVPFGYEQKQAEDLYNEPAIYDLIHPDPILREMIISLLTKDIDVSIFTNNRRTKLNKILDRLQVSPDIFNHIVTAEDVKGKPALAGFEQIILQSGCGPREILYVGDSEQADIVPARRIGMNTLQVCVDRHFERDAIHGSYHFRRPKIYDLPEVVDEMKELA